MQGMTAPVAVYGHQNGDCSVIGGFMYRGNLSPGLRGTYLYGDYCTGRMRILRREGGQWVSSVALTPGGRAAATAFHRELSAELARLTEVLPPGECARFGRSLARITADAPWPVRGPVQGPVPEAGS